MIKSHIAIGNHCSFLLPKKIISPFKTPAKGLITNILLDHSALILVEEVWLVKENPIIYCGWVPLPSLLKTNDHLMIPAKLNNILDINDDSLDLLIRNTLDDLIISTEGKAI